MSMTPRDICEDFAHRHKLIFTDDGECGFGRQCVGFIHGDNYLDYNPHSHKDYKPIDELNFDLFEDTAPPNAYHKHNCFAVLGSGDIAIKQLAAWVTAIEEKADVEVVSYATGATGFQALITGITGKALKVIKMKENNHA